MTPSWIDTQDITAAKAIVGQLKHLASTVHGPKLKSTIHAWAQMINTGLKSHNQKVQK